MNTLLPPPRELPPHRHARIRQEIIRTVSGERATRRRLTPFAVGAAVLTALVVAAWLVPWQLGGGPTLPVGGDSNQTERPTNDTPSPRLVPAAEWQGIERRCIEASARPDASATLYNLMEAHTGMLGLLYGSGFIIQCWMDGPGMPDATVNGPPQHPDWLPGPFASDLRSGRSEDPPKGGDDVGVYYDIAGGRISPNVARVTFTVRGETVDAVLANGTYLAEVAFRGTEDEYLSDSSESLRAYDARGRLLGTLGITEYELGVENGRCYVLPDGNVLADFRLRAVRRSEPASPKTCGPATPWP